jgi:ribosomal protein S18 acetylase RimI-like enzyme
MNTFKKVQTEKEIEMVEQLARIIWKDYFSSMIGDEIVDYMLEKLQSKNAISDQIQDGYLYYLIQSSKNFIGYFAILHKNETDELFLSKLYILHSERGKGSGKAAMKFIESLADKKNCKNISLTVFHKNIKAISIYEKMGFKKTGSIMRDIGSNIIIHDFLMEKIVTS